MTIEKPELTTKPINQMNIYGYEYYFDLLCNLYQNNKLPHSILLSGSKGLGKATFAYHFINFLLSKDEIYKYDRKNFIINPINSSYKMTVNGTHSNLFILDALDDENIKIEQIRKLLLFLNKTTYNKGFKFVLIDNADKLNLNASNALLKAIEEPNKNTYFLIINNDPQKILNTIKSRCIDFKIDFSFLEKKVIFNKIIKDYELNFTETDLNNFLYFDTHGNLLKYLNVLKDSNLSISEDRLECINYIMEIYNTNHDNKMLTFLGIFIQNYYNQLALKNKYFINSYYINLNKILCSIDNMKRFHLDKRNLIFSIDKIIKNER